MCQERAEMRLLAVSTFQAEIDGILYSQILVLAADYASLGRVCGGSARPKARLLGLSCFCEATLLGKTMPSN
jgi:hypothetical protein